MKWECVNCGKLTQAEVTEEFIGDLAWRYCNHCSELVDRYYEPCVESKTEPPRPKRFCFFIKEIDGDIHKPFRKYTRFQEFCLALRIGYFREAWRLLRGKPSRYIWEGEENNPMPFVFILGCFLLFF